MHDHRAGHCGSWADEQRRKILLDPGERTPVRLLRTRMIVEDADRSHRVVGCIDNIISHEAFNVTDDRNSAVLNSARELFGHPSLCSSLTNGGVHGTLLHNAMLPRARPRRSFIAQAGRPAQFRPSAE